MKGLSSRYGHISVDRITRDELREIDTGTLLITNKRLLFNGAKKNTSTQLTRVIHFTLYQDGIQIETARRVAAAASVEGEGRGPGTEERRYANRETGPSC